MGIPERINNNLSVLYNIEDEIYKALISDVDGTNPETITKPTDIDIGVIASQIEWLRRLSIDLLKQLYANHASGEFLKYILEDFFNSLKLEGETDEEWLERVTAIIFSPKVSTASIIYALRPYSSIEPEVYNIASESAFADFSFADITYSGSYIMDDGTIVIYVPAIAETFSSSYFKIKIVLYDTIDSNVVTVINIINRIIPAGIEYILQINYT
jgi:hypothetical protein